MFNIVRAAGYAVAIFGFAATPALASSSAVAALDVARIAVSIPTPVSAASQPTVLALNTVQLPAALSYDTNFATPLSEFVAVRPLAPLKLEVKAPATVEKPRGKSLVDLVSQFASNDVPDAEHECLAGAVYFESKGEPLEGQLAVAKVVMNRASSGKFPKSLCGVVKQKSQFSFVRGGRIPSIQKTTLAWRKAVAIAHIAKQELVEGLAGTALFFHARYVSPNWRGLKRVATVGNHIFYR